MSIPIHRSKPGWWQALCGNYICHGFWTNRDKEVTCRQCKDRMKKGEHRRRTRAEVLHPEFDRANRIRRGGLKPRRGEVVSK